MAAGDAATSRALDECEPLLAAVVRGASRAKKIGEQLVGPTQIAGPPQRDTQLSQKL